MSNEPEILTSRRGNLGVIKLNRPKAVNALTLNMINLFSAALAEFEQDDAVVATVLVGAGERGLCAGGDVKALHEFAITTPADGQVFFRGEYQLDHDIFTASKPVVAIMNGLVLGGGVGVAGPATHRVATDSTRWGMPETGIGFSPDVGGAYYLAQTPGRMGEFLATTGTHITGADAKHLGLADYLVNDADIEQLLADLEAVESAEDIDRIISAAQTDEHSSDLAAQAAWIDEDFAKDTAEEILAALEARVGKDEKSPAAFALKAYRRNSPTGIKTALEAVRRAKAHEDLSDTLRQDFRTTMNAMHRPDLAEGIRAQLIDKDRNPSWAPATFEEVSEADVQAFFGPIPGVDDLELN